MRRKNSIHRKFFELNDQYKIPQIGLGTVNIRGAKGVNAILSAIDNGYRYIDTSTNYHNEGAVGEAVRRSSLPREELIIVSKLPGADHEFDAALEIIQEQLFRTGLDYFDAYLIHWPLPKHDKYVEAWKALIQAQKLGLIKTIGVSNFMPDHLDRIIEETGVAPAINQSERHPYFNNIDVVKADAERNVLTQAWSPFGRATKNNVLEDKTITDIGEKYGKSNAQVIIRWNLQNGVMPIVKSSNPARQKENLNVFDFELTQEDIDAINALDQGEDGRIDGQNPYTYEEWV